MAYADCVSMAATIIIEKRFLFVCFICFCFYYWFCSCEIKGVNKTRKGQEYGDIKVQHIILNAGIIEVTRLKQKAKQKYELITQEIKNKRNFQVCRIVHLKLSLSHVS